MALAITYNYGSSHRRYACDNIIMSSSTVTILIIDIHYTLFSYISSASNVSVLLLSCIVRSP